MWILDLRQDDGLEENSELGERIWITDADTGCVNFLKHLTLHIGGFSSTYKIYV